MKRHVFLFAAVLATFSLVALDDAHADPYLGLDVGAAVPIPDTFDVEPTAGPVVGIRLGYRLPVPVLYLSAEALGAWKNFPHSESPQRVLSGRGGLRLGIDALLAVKLYGHVGYTDLKGEGTDYIVQAQGMSWDAGLAIDLTFIPVIDIGIHGGYVTLMDDNGDISWVEAGLHAELSF